MLSQPLHQSNSWTNFYVEKRHSYTTISLRNIYMSHINTSSQETLIFILSCLFETNFASNYNSLLVHLKLLKPVFRGLHRQWQHYTRALQLRTGWTMFKVKRGFITKLYGHSGAWILATGHRLLCQKQMAHSYSWGRW